MHRIDKMSHEERGEMLRRIVQETKNYRDNCGQVVPVALLIVIDEMKPTPVDDLLEYLGGEGWTQLPFASNKENQVGIKIGKETSYYVHPNWK